MNTAYLDRFVGREWALIFSPKKDRRRDADKHIEVLIGQSMVKPWGVLTAAKFLRDADVPQEVALRVLTGRAGRAE